MRLYRFSNTPPIGFYGCKATWKGSRLKKKVGGMYLMQWSNITRSNSQNKSSWRYSFAQETVRRISSKFSILILKTFTMKWKRLVV